MYFEVVVLKSIFNTSKIIREFLLTLSFFQILDSMLTFRYGSLRHQMTTKKPTTSHFNVFNGIVVHNHQKNPFLKSISKSTKQQPSLTVDYLVNSCGLSPEKAISTAKKFNLCSIEKADSVISLFQSYGLTKTHIIKIISQHPQLLTVDPNKYLKPKFEFLSNLCISEADFLKLITSCPRLFAASLENQIIPNYNFLNRSLGGGNFDILIVLKRWPSILYTSLENVLIPNIQILQVHGVPDYNIAKMLLTFPRTLCDNSKRFKVNVEKVKKLGFDVESTLFYRAVYVLTGFSKSSWDKKLMVYREFGLLEKDVVSAFKKQPYCMTLSEEKIRRGLEFFLKKLKCNPTDISFCPALLLYSLDNRIVPRCAVLKILYAKGIIRNKLSLFTVIKMAEREFSEKFVIEYQETVPEVMNAYEGGIEFEGFGEVVEVKDLFMEPVLDHIPPIVTPV